MRLEILSTSYTGRPGKIALKGNFLGAVRNIRVKISNQFILLKIYMWLPTHYEVKEVQYGVDAACHNARKDLAKEKNEHIYNNYSILFHRF